MQPTIEEYSDSVRKHIVHKSNSTKFYLLKKGYLRKESKSQKLNPISHSTKYTSSIIQVAYKA